MRGILRHQSSDGRRRARPQTRLFTRRASGKLADRSAQARAAGSPAAPSRAISPAAAESSFAYDAAARRVRAAGGPNDQASYTCVCGCVFAAPVSASVSCPHCGAEQDW